MYPASPYYERIAESCTLSVLQERRKKSENETVPVSILRSVLAPASPYPHRPDFTIGTPVQTDTAFYPSRVSRLEGRLDDFIGCDIPTLWERPSIFRPIPSVRTEKGFKWLQYPLVLTPGIGKTFLCPRSCLIFNALLTPSLVRGIHFCVN